MSELAEFPLDDAVPTPRRSRREILTEVALAAPNLMKLLYRLMRDRRDASFSSVGPGST